MAAPRVRAAVARAVITAGRVLLVLGVEALLCGVAYGIGFLTGWSEADKDAGRG